MVDEIQPLRIGMVAGEPSGDTLGAGLLAALHKKIPRLQSEGIGGPKMQAQRLKSLAPMEALSVGGLSQVLYRLPKILTIRRQVKRHFLKNPPDVFIGIDAPDFNLPLEQALRQNGIKTVHYVSPTVWAWRPKRIDTVKKAADCVLLIFPFEVPLYKRHQIPHVFIGHPLADEISPGKETNSDPFRSKVIALLPGSRDQEVKRLTPLFLQTARWCLNKKPPLTFVLPTVCPSHTALIKSLIDAFDPTLPITLMEGESKKALQKADLVLTASGTATLECLLFRKPMVVAYCIDSFSYFLLKNLVKAPYCAMPNLLANKLLVPEYIQKNAVPEEMGGKMLELLQNSISENKLFLEFEKIHRVLRQNANEKAAEAVLGLVGFGVGVTYIGTEGR
ncbi:MAG: lipid-A-disaccharide synthase [Gammaproteobacteria bacterium]|nr:lipid-A-disaccharide synthase [Gammaproteobacteria bacterium]